MIEIINAKNKDCVVPKKWGSEVVIHNDEDYCGKILKFNAGAQFSMHFHMKKKETWYVVKGSFVLKHYNTHNATEYETGLKVGDIIEIPRGQPHQLFAATAGEIFEISTQHFRDDSYRIKEGDSQNA